MSEMVERGIRAAEDATGDGFVATFGRDAAEAIVRAIIAAMSEPSAALLNGGDDPSPAWQMFRGTRST